MALAHKQKKSASRFGAPLFTSWHNPPWDHPILANPYYRPPLRFFVEDPVVPTDIYEMPPGVTATAPASSSAIDKSIALGTNIVKCMEYLGYTRGKGSDPSGNHEGCVMLQHWMENYSPFEPLLQSSKDILTGSALAATDHPTHSWFTASARASILTNVTTPLLTAIRDECIARNVCFPLRWHQDIELFDASTWTKAGGRGWLQAAALDARWNTEEVLPGLTSAQIIAIIAVQGFEYDSSLGWQTGKNYQATMNFMWGLQHAVNSYALYRAFDAYLPAYFGSPHCLTSNYNFYAADGMKQEIPHSSPQISRRFIPTYQSMPAIVCYPYAKAGPMYSAGDSDYKHYRRMVPINLMANTYSSQKAGHKAVWNVYPGSPESDYTVTAEDSLWFWDIAYDQGITDFIGWAGAVPDWDLYLWTINKFLRDKGLESARSTSFFGLREQGHQRKQP